MEEHGDAARDEAVRESARGSSISRTLREVYVYSRSECCPTLLIQKYYSSVTYATDSMAILLMPSVHCRAPLRRNP